MLIMTGKMKKRGMEFAITTLVIIILGMLILGVLTLAFTGTFKKFWTGVKGYSSDIDNLNKICQSQCDLDNSQAFCCDNEKILEKEKINCTDSRLKLNCNINCLEVNC